MDVSLITIGLVVAMTLVFARLFPLAIGSKPTPYLMFFGALSGAGAAFIIGSGLDGEKLGFPLTMGVAFAPVLITLLLRRFFTHDNE
ncbi:MAG: hypothetical protein KGZ64_11390 [Thermaerobacter sp.]|nr:hypothetical protein [Thermaerobacter sp.]